MSGMSDAMIQWENDKRELKDVKEHLLRVQREYLDVCDDRDLLRAKLKVANAIETLTADEVADRLRLTAETVLRWRAAGRIPAIQIGPHRFRFVWGEVLDALRRPPAIEVYSDRGTL